ncbi:hypothetical protein GCM10022419_105920 [Nonomuraea rosea]|uniref:ORC1/DEAH AAA+ ATPase domain-containing protein n=1 Tax=Nonomuraea rosea TaxID=638574 RepID=A0ABP6ZGQ8_9ACTN
MPMQVPDVLPAEASDHYLNLPDAQVVATDALLTTRSNLSEVIDAKAMMCVHGDAGLGKTFSVNASLRHLAPDQSHRIQFRERPTPRYIRHKLFETLKISGRMPSRPAEFDKLLRNVLAEEFRVFVCDEAQWLSTECFEYWRHLWDDGGTDLALVFVGGDKCYEVLDSQPMLASRMYVWQEYRQLTEQQVREVIPAWHPLWAAADPADIDFVYRHAARGNFRIWAKITHQLLRMLPRLGQEHVDRTVIRRVFARLGGHLI